MKTLQKALLTFAVAVVAWLGQPGAALAAYPAYNQAHGLVRVDTVYGYYALLPPQDEPKFGFSVAVDGDWLVVGAPNTITHRGIYGVARHGMVFVFHHEDGQWWPEARIPLGQYGDSQCGYSVALDLPHLIIGCPGDSFTNLSDERGSLYWYQLVGGQWSLEYQWNGIPGARCGTSVALALDGRGGAYAAYGCPYDNNEAGTVWTWRYTSAGGWAIDTGLSASDGASGDWFGWSLSMDYESGFIGSYWLAVGAPLNQVGSTNPDGFAAGAAYVFSGGGLGWAEGYSDTGFPWDGPYKVYGWDVAIRDDRFLVGAPNGLSGPCQDTYPRCGTADFHAYHSGAWDNTAVADVDEYANTGGNPPGPQLGMRFGDAVAFGFSGMAAISAPNTDGYNRFGGVQEDEGYVELRPAGNPGLRLGELRAPLRFSRNAGHFGGSLDFGDEVLAVGAPDWGSTDASEGREGVVHIYQSDRIFAADLEPSATLDPGFEATHLYGLGGRGNNFWWGWQSNLIAGAGPPIFGGSTTFDTFAVRFGGTGNTDHIEGVISQFVRIPADPSADLSFCRINAVAPVGNAELKVNVDGDTLATYDLVSIGVETGWDCYNLDLDEYADGEKHLLAFRYVHDGNGTGTDGATWIDDVYID